MLIDHEAVVLRIKEHVESKHSHGQRELREVIAKAEVENKLDEGLPERALRLYGVALSGDLMTHPGKAPDSAGPDGTGENGAASHPIEVRA